MLGNWMMPSPLGASGKPRGSSILSACLLGLAACSPAPRIGFLGTLSGPGSELGTSGRDGAQLAVEDAGIELVVCDDRADEAAAAACMAWFDSLGIGVVIGPMTSNVAERVTAEATKREIVAISPTVSTTALSGRDDFFVRLMPENAMQAILLARHFVEKRNRSVSILFSKSNAAYAEPLAGRVAELLVQAGVSIGFLEGYAGGRDLHFDSWIARMEDSSAVLVVGSSMDVGVFLKDRERSGKVLHVHSAQWGMGEDLLRVAGSAAEGLVLPGMPEQVSDSREIQELRRRFRERYAHVPSFGAIFGWEAAQVAMRLASAPRGRESLRAVLRDTTFAPLGWRLGLDSFGDARRMPVLCRVRNGRFEIEEESR